MARRGPTALSFPGKLPPPKNCGPPRKIATRWVPRPGRPLWAGRADRLGSPPVLPLRTKPVFPATLFDFNGVLIDDEHVHLEAFRDVPAPLGIEVSEEAYWERYLGFDDRGAFEAILRDAGRTTSPRELTSLIEAKRPHYMNRAKASLRTFPGAGELVTQRAAAGPVGVVSGAL